VAAVGFTARETAGGAKAAQAANDYLTWEANDFSWVIAGLGNKLADRLQDCDGQTCQRRGMVRTESAPQLDGWRPDYRRLRRGCGELPNDLRYRRAGQREH
jgi:hypothetical protein